MSEAGADLGPDPALTAALDRLRAAHPAPAVPLLIEQLAPGQWQSSRAAVAALRREGPAAVIAAPAVARWLAAAIDAESANLERHGYAVREALGALRGWWTTARALAADGPASAAAATLLGYFAAEVEPMVRRLLDGPHGAAHRGAVDYLGAAAGDRPAAIEALRRFLARPAEADDGYTRAAAITALQALSSAEAEPAPAPAPSPEPTPAPAAGGLRALTAAHPDTDVPLDPLAGDVDAFVERELVPLLLREFESGPPAARLAALTALRQLGTRADAASAAMWRLVRRGPDDDPEVERLRQRTLQVFVPMVTRRLTPDAPPADGADAGRAETARTLLVEMAMGDPDPRVRAEALEALTRLADDDPAIWAAAVESANSAQPLVRGTATRLIALLGVLARRSRLGRPPPE